MSDAPIAEVGTGPIPQSATDKALDELILQQAMLTGALEILPDRLANVAILPLQLRLVYQIGQRSGQRLDVDQVKDLVATLGLGAAAQVMEGVVMKVLLFEIGLATTGASLVLATARVKVVELVTFQLSVSNF
jgi:uncharacterized protein (DUF697 family)